VPVSLLTLGRRSQPAPTEERVLEPV
jgi:hypothetical protein